MFFWSPNTQKKWILVIFLTKKNFFKNCPEIQSQAREKPGNILGSVGNLDPKLYFCLLGHGTSPKKERECLSLWRRKEGRLRKTFKRLNMLKNIYWTWEWEREREREREREAAWECTMHYNDFALKQRCSCTITESIYNVNKSKCIPSIFVVFVSLRKEL